ncbi:hypothetical protein ABW19_dt0210467 [Dactylella cylindrospora]|nr:hypothetical protein ABW19_dt0210467 [Dactylella cylindrospora]
MSFGQPGQFGILNNAQNAPSSAFGRSASISAAPPAAQGPAEVLLGDEVQETESDVIGYVALAGELKVKVFDGQYPENDLPIPSSQLLAICQKRQLFAAGGPQGLVVARTSTLRAAFKNKSAASGNFIPFQPECVIPMTLKLSHVAFTADGSHLVLAAELGGVALYLVDDILSQGNQVQPQAQLATGPLLELKPIPTVQDSEKVCVLVGSGWSQGGNLGIINVKTGQLQANLKSGVTTVSWSPKGKQIVCGGSGGGLAWIRPDGTEADVVPGIPNHPNHFVSSIYWIESNIVFVVVAPKLQPGSQAHDNEAVHFVLMREGRKHTFYRVNDMTPPFGMSSRPTYHSFIHLKGWAPSMKDCVVLSNTCSTDIGTVLRLHNTPFTPTSILSDGRRATLPLTADGGDTTPIGLALDLTATDSERVDNPYPNIERSSTSLPCMWVLTNEGVISAYWVVYSDAIKVENSSAAYPELLAYESQQPPQTPQRTTTAAFGQTAFGGQASTSSFASQTSAFAAPQNNQSGGFGSQPKTPAFGQPSTPTSAFGAKPAIFGQSSTPVSTFGQTSQPANAFAQSSFGQTSNPTPVFGQQLKPAAAFGQASAPQSTFGQTSTPQSTFGQTSAPQPTFGQPAFGSTSTLGRPGLAAGTFSASPAAPTSTFGSGTAFGSTPTTSGFGSTALGQKPATPAFGSTSALGSAAPAFGSATALGGSRPAFGQSSLGAAPSGSGFGQTSQLGTNRPGFGSSAAGGGGFAKFASGGGFLGGSNASSNAPAAFLQSSGSSNAFANKESDTFGSLKGAGTTPAFGAPASGFKMASAFGSTSAPDTTKNNTAAAPAAGAFGTAFGGALGTALSQPADSAHIKDDEMKDSDDEEASQPRQGLRGGNMFNVSSALGAATSTTPAKEPPKALAPAFGQPSQSSTSGTQSSEPVKTPAFATGLFGSAMNKDQSKGAFGSTLKTPALAPAFGTQEQKSSGVVSAFAPQSPEKSTSQIGTGLFGSALQRTTSGAQTASAFENATGPISPLSAAPSTTTPSAFGKVNPLGPATAFSKPATGPTAPAFGKPSTPVSAFASLASPTSKPVVPAFGQKATPPASSPEKAQAKDIASSAASKGLPNDDSDNETVHSPSAAEAAPLPPDFISTVKKSKPAPVDDAPLPPDFISGTKKSKLVDDAPLPPDFLSSKTTPSGQTPLPGSAPRTPQPDAKPIPPVKEEMKPSVPPQDSKSVLLSGRPAATNFFSDVFDKSPSKFAESSNLSASPSEQKKTPGTKPVNPMAARKGGTPKQGVNLMKTTSSGAGRLPSQKPGIATQSTNIIRNAINQGTKLGQSSGSGSSSVLVSAPGEKIDSFLTAESAALPSNSDDSDDVTDEEQSVGEDDQDLTGEEAETGDEESPVDRSSELGDEEDWEGEEESGDEEYPIQSKAPTTLSSNTLFTRISGPVKAGPPVETSKSPLRTPALPSKQPLSQPKSKEGPPAAKVALSPKSAALKKQEDDDKRRAEEERQRIELEKSRAEREALERQRVAAESLAKFEALRRQHAAEVAQMNSLERTMRDQEEAYRQSLQRPCDPSPGLKQLIPYRESGPFTNFKGNHAVMEQLIITLERRIDNFGMNMRNLECYVLYNRRSDHFTLDDERPVEEISIKAAPDVSLMAKDLTERAQNFNEKFELDALKGILMSLINDVDYLCSRASDIPNIILLHTHPDLRGHIRKRPLAAQQRMQQASLRRKVPLLRRRFKRAEDEFRVLQAHVATINKNQKANYGDIRPPTVEQVRETVARLTNVAKEKAERLDSLEEALRRMRIRSVSPAISRGTTPSFSRAGSVSFSAAGGKADRERSGTPSWKPPRKGKDSGFSTPPRNLPGPDNFDYYENTVDSPISRFSGNKQIKTSRGNPGVFGLIEEELGDDEYLNDQNPSSTKNIPIATSYDRGMAELRKEALTTPKKGDGANDIPSTPASRQVNRLLKDEMEEITGDKKAAKVWMGADDYAEDKKFRREAGKRMAKVIGKVGVKMNRVSPI